MDSRRIVAVVKPFTLDAVVEALGPFLVGEIEVTEARGYGRQKGHLELYAGKEYELNFLPKVRIELAVEAKDVFAALAGGSSLLCAIVNQQHTRPALG